VNTFDITQFVHASCVDGYEIAKQYEQGKHKGWCGLDLAKAAFQMLDAQGCFAKMSAKYQAGKKMMLYWVARKLFGHDTPNYPQQIGDCVSFGAKNATEYLTACQIMLAGLEEKFRPVFPPYYYGTGRIYVGHSGGYSDGSSGAWMAEAVRTYGTLFADESGVPQYQGSVAKSWGASAGNGIDKWKDTASKYLVKSTAPINSWEDLVAAISNGYPCTTASDIGYSMEASSDGFHRQTTSWSHQMCFIGVDETYTEPYAIILNNWGDVHGHLKDFQTTSEDLPVGVLRVRKADAMKHIQAGETFAYSQFDGFPDTPLDKKLFLMV
jgi:hypothetical protein